MKTVFAVLFVVVLQLAAAGSSDTLKSPYIITRLEADSGHLFFYKCTLSTYFYVDSIKAYVKTNYYKKITLDSSCLQITQSAKPSTDTLQIIIHQAGTLDLQVVGPGILFFTTGMNSAGTRASFALQAGMVKTVWEYDTGSAAQDTMGRLMVRWTPTPTAVRSAGLQARAHGQSSSIAPRGTVLLDLLGRRIPPASRQGAGIRIERIGVEVRELQAGKQ